VERKEGRGKGCVIVVGGWTPLERQNDLTLYQCTEMRSKLTIHISTAFRHHVICD